MLITLRQIAADGEKKGYYYAAARHAHTTTTKELAKLVQDKCTVTETDVMAVFHAMSDVIHLELMHSNSVKLDNIGTFSATVVNKESVKDPNKVGVATIKGVKVSFKAEYEKTGYKTRVAADGNEKVLVDFANVLTRNATYEPDALMKKKIKEYNDANAVGG
jgi:predicted histone-like DNA-binding protein